MVFPDIEAISHKAAEMFVDLSRNCMAKEGRFTVALSGGSTPQRLYVLLASDLFSDGVDWRRVHIFWCDERCVPKEDEESNFRVAFDLLLSKVSIPEVNIHRIKGEYGPEKGAGDYEEEIRRFFDLPERSELPAFDLIILGVGEDGHTASLFPGSETLSEKERMAVPVYMKRPKIDRITLTLPVLNNAHQIVFLVSSLRKREIIRNLFGDKQKRRLYPAGMINPIHGSIAWLIDKEAAKDI